MYIILDHIEDITANVHSFWFKTERHFNYTAGQFIEMYLPHDNADMRGQKHWFTLSSSPTEKLISITTKQASGQSSTFKQILFDLKPGTKIKISEPMGDFVLPKDAAIPLIFIAGGIGITPMRSMIKWLSDTNEKRNIHLVYGARSPGDLAYLDLFKSYGAKYDLVLSKPVGNWPGHTGQLSGEFILKLVGKNEHQLIYISGPEQMTERLESELLASGVAKEKLVLDFFPGYPQV